MSPAPLAVECLKNGRNDLETWCCVFMQNTYMQLSLFADYVYFENSSSNPYLIRRIEELNKVRAQHSNAAAQPVWWSGSFCLNLDAPPGETGSGSCDLLGAMSRLFKNIVLFYMCGCLVCMYISVPCGCLGGQRRVLDPGTEWSYTSL